MNKSNLILVSLALYLILFPFYSFAAISSTEIGYDETNNSYAEDASQVSITITSYKVTWQTNPSEIKYLGGNFDWEVRGTGNNPASPEDFEGDKFPSGSGNFVGCKTFFKDNPNATCFISVAFAEIKFGIKQDVLVEDSEEFEIVISNFNAVDPDTNQVIGKVSVTNTIKLKISDDDLTVFAIEAWDKSKKEGHLDTTEFVFLAYRTQAGKGAYYKPETLKYEIFGNDIDDKDIVNKTGTFTFNSGEKLTHVRIPVYGDYDNEKDETFSIKISRDENAYKYNENAIWKNEGIASAVILNDDDPNTPGFRITALDDNKEEGHNEFAYTDYRFKVELTGGSQSVTSLGVEIRGDRGPTKVDYRDMQIYMQGVGSRKDCEVSVPGFNVTTEIFNYQRYNCNMDLGNNFSSGIITVGVKANLIIDPGKIISVQIYNRNASIPIPEARSRIKDDDSNIILFRNYSALTPTLGEGTKNNGVFRFVVKCEPTSSNQSSNCDDTKFDWVVRGGSVNPVSADDFPGNQFPSGTATIKSNLQAVVEFPVKADGITEEDESLEIALGNFITNKQGVNLIAPLNGIIKGTILDDDYYYLSLESIDKEVFEGDSGITEAKFKLTREGGDLSKGMGLGYRLKFDSGPNAADKNDFKYDSGIIFFDPNETSTEFTVKINGDSVFEGYLQGQAINDVNFEGYSVEGISDPKYSKWRNKIATSKILDDDLNPNGSIAIYPLDADKPEGNEGKTIYKFKVEYAGNYDLANEKVFNNFTINVMPGTNDNSVSKEEIGKVLDNAGNIISSVNIWKLPTITILPNQKEVIFGVEINSDTEFEQDEEFLVKIEAFSSVLQANKTFAKGIVRNDDIGFSITPESANLYEGNP